MVNVHTHYSPRAELLRYSKCYLEDEERAQEERTHRLNCQLLDVSLIRQGDEYRRCYANILYQWQLLEQRAEVVKLRSKRSEDQTEIGK